MKTIQRKKVHLLSFKGAKFIFLEHKKNRLIFNSKFRDKLQRRNKKGKAQLSTSSYQCLDGMMNGLNIPAKSF